VHMILFSSVPLMLLASAGVRVAGSLADGTHAGERRTHWQTVLSCCWRCGTHHASPFRSESPLSIDLLVLGPAPVFVCDVTVMTDECDWHAGTCPSGQNGTAQPR